MRRGELVACTYASRKPNFHSPGGLQSRANDPDQLQGKIDRLEQLIIKLVENPRDNSVDSGAARVRTGKADEFTLRAIPPSLHAEAIDLMAPAEQQGTLEPESLSLKTLRIDGHHPKSLSVDEAHWARLLNEVCANGQYAVSSV